MHSCITASSLPHIFVIADNAVNGKPACANDDLLTGVLRNSWNWSGFVVSDYDAWKEIKDTHQYASTYEDAAAVGLNAGLDQEGGFGTYSAIDAMPAALAAGSVTADTVKRSFRRLMRIRLRLGMFDPPATVAPNNASYTPANKCESDEHIALARKAVRESIVPPARLQYPDRIPDLTEIYPRF